MKAGILVGGWVRVEGGCPDGRAHGPICLSLAPGFDADRGRWVDSPGKRGRSAGTLVPHSLPTAPGANVGLSPNTRLVPSTRGCFSSGD